nr:cytochrome c family protein [uncultured Dongia sp.]
MSLEANKIAAAVLVGGMLTLSVGLVSNIIYGTPAGAGAEHAEAGAAEAGAAESAPAAATPAAAPVSSVPLIAAADVAMGEKASGKCKTCHTFEKGGPNRVGPNLWGVLGGHSAHKDDFAGYSDVIKNLNITWDYDHLDQFLANPKAYAKGTKMSFAGLKKPEERAALIRWLRDQSDSPVPLPQ